MNKLILTITLIGLFCSFGIGQSVKKIVDSKPINYSEFSATWYCLKGRTATGNKVKHGVIAVDPKVIKLTSIVEIDGLGFFKALDTGGNIKGKRIDIWTPSCSNAIKKGRKKVKLRVVK